MARGLLFDLYGVVMRVQAQDAIAAIEQAAGFGGAQLWEPFWALRRPYDAGLVSATQYWQQIGEAAGREIGDIAGAIEAEVVGWSNADAEMVEYVRGLAARVPVGVLSDAPVEVIEMLERTQPWLTELPVAIYSARVGRCKPDPEVYRLALAGLGLAPEDVFFTDDRPGNVAAAQALGMPAAVFTGLDALRRLVEAHLAG